MNGGVLTRENASDALDVAGLFVWGGFDYRGEPQPFEWPSVFSHWGLMDNCGFGKDTFHMLRSYYADASILNVCILDARGVPVPGRARPQESMIWRNENGSKSGIS